MKTIKKISIETVPVILGVLIALFIENWKEDLADKKFLTQVYSNIEKEMTSNLEGFNTVLPLQEALVDSLAFYRLNQDVTVVDVFNKTGGLQIPSISNTSWNSFLNSNLGLVDIDVIATTTAVEELNFFMKSKADKLAGFALDNIDATDSNVKEKLIIRINDLMETELQLVELYKAYVEWRKNDSR